MQPTPRPADDPGAGIAGAAVELPCERIDEAVDFFRDGLGFRVDEIVPADDPSVAQLSGHGLRLRLVRGAAGAAGAIRLSCTDPAALRQRLVSEYGSRCAGTDSLMAPNGTLLILVRDDVPLALPPLQPGLVVTRLTGEAAWQTGRAGMLYRDLIPGRQGGRFIASHIRIHEGGPVRDWVHYHEIRFQMIFCHRGWVRVVYEDQGEPFVMRAGDCVLQPPQIRHRVLESSPGLEVVEVGCPARHRTLADHDLPLPTPDHRPQRDFGGQRFALHRAEGAAWRRWRMPGFVFSDFGFAAATGGLARAGVFRRAGTIAERGYRHGGELWLLFVLQGRMLLRLGVDCDVELRPGDCCTVPGDLECRFEDTSADLQCLEVMLAGDVSRAARSVRRVARA